MSVNVQSYLSKMGETCKDSKLQQKVKTLNATVLNDIGNQIIQSRIIIPQHEKKLKLKTTNDDDHSDMKKLDQRFIEIKQKKKAILAELQDIEMMQSSIKLNKSSLKKSTLSIHAGKNAKIRSELTQDQIAKIKQIYKKQKKFKKKIQSKIKKYEEDMEKYRIQQQQQQKQKHRQLCLEKHQQRQRYIKEIEERNKKRQKLLKQQKQKILELKKKQKLYEKLQSNFMKEKQIQLNEIKQKLQEHKKKRQFSFDDMKRHEEQYIERKKFEDEKRLERVQNYKNPNQIKFPCLFLDKIKDEQERHMYEKEQKTQMIKTFAQKKSAYAEEVRKHLHQKIKTMSESKLSQIKDSKVETAPKWLNTPQKYQEGTNYMRQVNSVISKLPRKAANTTQSQQPRFKNYLNDLKNENKDKKQEAKQKNINNVATNMSILSAKENITTGNLAKSVKAKIQLMNKLHNLQ